MPFLKNASSEVPSAQVSSCNPETMPILCMGCRMLRLRFSEEPVQPDALDAKFPLTKWC